MSEVRDPLMSDGLDPGLARPDVPPGTLALVNSGLFADASNFELRFVPDYQRITAIVQALRTQNIQVASGVVGQPPVPAGHAFQVPVTTLGRLLEPEQFESVVLKGMVPPWKG